MIETPNKSVLDLTKFLTQQVLLSFFQIHQGIPIINNKIAQVFNYKSILIFISNSHGMPLKKLLHHWNEL